MADVGGERTLAWRPESIVPLSCAGLSETARPDSCSSACHFAGEGTGEREREHAEPFTRKCVVSRAPRARNRATGPRDSQTVIIAGKITATTSASEQRFARRRFSGKLSGGRVFGAPSPSPLVAGPGEKFPQRSARKVFHSRGRWLHHCGSGKYGNDVERDASSWRSRCLRRASGRRDLYLYCICHTRYLSEHLCE